MKKILSLLAALLCIGLVLAGCKNNSDSIGVSDNGKKTELVTENDIVGWWRMWGDRTEKEDKIDIAEIYNFQANGNFEVFIIEITNGKLNQKGGNKYSTKNGTWSLENGMLSTHYDSYTDEFPMTNKNSVYSNGEKCGEKCTKFIEASSLIGTWTLPESSEDDKVVFNQDKTGKLIEKYDNSSHETDFQWVLLPIAKDESVINLVIYNDDENLCEFDVFTGSNSCEFLHGDLGNAVAFTKKSGE